MFSQIINYTHFFIIKNLIDQRKAGDEVEEEEQVFATALNIAYCIIMFTIYIKHFLHL